VDLAGRVALVTGGARRVGRAIVERLARAGCHVAVHYHSSGGEAAEAVQACRTAGVEAESFAADLADAASTAQLAPAVLSQFKRLDILVNNASVFDPMKLDDFALAAWDQTLQVNLSAPAILAHCARDALRAARGAIVNLCDASISRPWEDHLAYSVSKGGLLTLTQVLAKALAPDVRVVGVAPGIAAWPDDYCDKLRTRLTAKVPLQRAGAPEDIAAAVEFLLRDGDYITGTVIPIDGGRHLA
jgi:pteridine reductase